MAFDFSCPVCRHTTEMDNSAAGEMGVCPKCDAEVLIQRGPVGSLSEVSTPKRISEEDNRENRVGRNRIRSTATNLDEDPQGQDEEQLSQTASASAANEGVELGTGTTIATRIVMIAVFLCIMSGGGYMIYNGFELLGYQYKGIVGILEDKPENGLSDYQKKLLEESKANKGPPDYSHLAVEPMVRTEEEIRADEALGGGGGGFGGASDDGGEDDNRGGQGSGGRSFDPEQIFDDRDEDMDGLLTGDEISERMQSRVEQMDENEDGAISKEEFLAAMQRIRASRQGGGGEGGAPRGGRDAGRPE